ncbi:hypothetical protein SCOR_10210 [Sulfidibacter corallicola]|uniref:Uncharacterized protein n=1 Tax=Sulfidibacter corallicola TaxID=2818388 RepID=A0A8A4TFF3_SULCO|nr:hypothetical protein [Sulfidibacter corallicola]QTD48280.1 hypothetical protein J3U87_22095 [Sulfidibacter corallicola]
MNLCSTCVENTKYVQRLERYGKRGRCAFNPNHTGAVQSVYWFTQFLDRDFRAAYEHGEEYPIMPFDGDRPDFDHYGETLFAAVMNFLVCNQDLAKTIAAELIDQEPSHSKSGSCFYADDVMYELKRDADARRAEESRDYHESYGSGT